MAGARRFPALALVLATFVIAPAAAVDLDGPSMPKQATGPVPDRILVGFEALPQDRAAFAASLGGEVLGAIEELGILILRVPEARADGAIAEAREVPGVRFAEHEQLVQALFTPNDVLYGQQWAPPKVKLPAAWDRTLGSHGRMIAILDTGIDRAHSDILNNYCHAGAAFLSGTGVGVPAATEDDNGHGTHVAGIAAAAINNINGIAGAGNSCLMAVKALNGAGLGFLSDVAAGIRYAADNGANIISMSIGADSGASALESAVNYAWGKGVLLVAAAGNDGGCGKTSNKSSVDYPGKYANVVAVASSNENDGFSSFSSCGPEVDLIAPGSNILSTFTGNSYLILSGTSMATPLVSGVAALAWSCNPGLSNSQVRSALETSADSIGLIAAKQGKGRLDAGGATASTGC